MNTADLIANEPSANLRAVIDLAAAAQPGARGVLEVRIEADGRQPHITSWLFTQDLPGVRLGDDLTTILPAALAVLTAEGFELAGVGWQVANDEVSAGIKRIGEAA